MAENTTELEEDNSQEESRPVYKGWALALIFFLLPTIILLILFSCIVGDYRGLLIFPILIVVGGLFKIIYSIYVLWKLFRQGYTPMEIRDLIARKELVLPKNSFLSALKMFLLAYLFYTVLSPVLYLNIIVTTAYVLMNILAEIHGDIGKHTAQIIAEAKKKHDQLKRELEDQESKEGSSE